MSVHSSQPEHVFINDKYSEYSAAHSVSWISSWTFQSSYLSSLVGDSVIQDTLEFATALEVLWTVTSVFKNALLLGSSVVV
jgi:hypothetical protein